MHLTAQQLKDLGYVETSPGTFKRPPDAPTILVKEALELIKQSQKPPTRIRQSTKPLMNKLEGEFLEQLRKEDPCSCYIPQSLRFRLANGLWYKPDFVCLERLQAWEVKGPHAFRGGFENLKIAAYEYQDFTWRLVWKQGGIWCEQIVLP